MITCLLGLLRTERLAREMSAVTRVMEILETAWSSQGHGGPGHHQEPQDGPCPAQSYCPGLWPPGEGCVSPAIKPVLQEVEQSFLHHVCDLQWGWQGQQDSQAFLSGPTGWTADI